MCISDKLTTGAIADQVIKKYFIGFVQFRIYFAILYKIIKPIA